MIAPTVEHPTGQDNFYIVWSGVDRNGDSRSFAFSYRTVIGFNEHEGRGWTVRDNEWGPTTGKHLNHLDGGDKSTRVDGVTFERLLAAL